MFIVKKSKCLLNINKYKITAFKNFKGGLSGLHHNYTIT